MRPASLRLSARRSAIAVLPVLAVLGWPAAALANHHHIGGSGSGGGADIDADCLLWGYVVRDGGAADRADASAPDADAAVTDAGDVADAAQPVDAATSDAGSAPPAGAVLVCLQHATLFGCDCTVGPAAGEGWSRGALALLTATMMLGARRRRRTPSRGGTP